MYYSHALPWNRRIFSAFHQEFHKIQWSTASASFRGRLNTCAPNCSINIMAFHSTYQLVSFFPINSFKDFHWKYFLLKWRLLYYQRSNVTSSISLFVLYFYRYNYLKKIWLYGFVLENGRQMKIWATTQLWNGSESITYSATLQYMSKNKYHHCIAILMVWLETTSCICAGDFMHSRYSKVCARSRIFLFFFGF